MIFLYSAFNNIFQDWRPIFESRVVSFHLKDCLSWSSDGRRLTVANLSPEVFILGFKFEYLLGFTLQIQVVELCKSINLLPEDNTSTEC